MVKLDMLRNRMDNSGMTMTAIAKMCGMSRTSLYKKLDGKCEFKVSEIVNLCKALHMTDSERNNIFFKS